MKAVAEVENESINLPAKPMEEQVPTLFDLLEEFDGMADDLPFDLAANLDHYVHGQSRP